MPGTPHVHDDNEAYDAADAGSVEVSEEEAERLYLEACAVWAAAVEAG